MPSFPEPSRPIIFASPHPGRAPNRYASSEKFFEWIAGNPPQSRPGRIELAWIDVDAGERLDHLCDRFQPADVLLGGPVTEYARLAGTGRLATLDGGNAPFWAVARRSVIVLAGGGPESLSRMAFDDPRTDPMTLAWATGQLSKGGWREGYAKLVSLFGHASHKPGWRSGSALAPISAGKPIRLCGRSRLTMLPRTTIPRRPV